MPEILSYIFNMDITLLGERALLLRRQLDVRQEEIADIVGVSRTYISKIEHGKAEGVTLDVVGRLADALGVSVAYLLGHTDPRMGVNVLKEESAIYGELSPEEEELIELIHEMTPAQRRQMLFGARLILGSQNRIE